jgi:hypothetical protein
LTVTDSTFESNTGDRGGALDNLGGIATVSGSTFHANSAIGAGSNRGGGAIDNHATLTVSNCTLTGNSARHEGGGIAVDIGAAPPLTTVSNCTLTDNTAELGGGISCRIGGLTVSNCTLTGNSASRSGGGIYNEDRNSNSDLMVSNCTLTGNSAPEGGGIYNQRTQVGSGTTLRVSNSTLTGNAVGGGLFVHSGDVLVQNSIIAQNGDNDVSGQLDTSSSYNLIGTGGSGGLVDGVNHNLVGVTDPGLAPLGDYGGPTQTISLLPGSPALNAGDPEQLDTPDQRGVVRTGGVNIGAFQASAASFVLSAPASVNPGEAFDMTVTVVDRFGQLAVGYTGTIHFSSSDSDARVVLPPDYTFQRSDGGMVTFLAGVSLFSPGRQTLTATDPDGGITGSTVVRL